MLSQLTVAAHLTPIVETNANGWGQANHIRLLLSVDDFLFPLQEFGLPDRY